LLLLLYVGAMQGMLALTFADAKDYSKITGSDKITINVAGSAFAPGKQLTMRVHPANGGASFEVKLNHTFNEEQIQWFKSGSALNLMKAKAAAAK
jgi:aconitate hydratase